MTEKKEQKQNAITKFAKHEVDTGSTEVQIALCTIKISLIAKHLKANKNDFAALRGLRAIVARRKKLLAYLLRNSPQSYASIIKELGIRG